jgi:biotin transport system substrate-specific component
VVGGWISISLPGTPVPGTLQTLFVVMAGVLLGPADGALAALVYVALGAAGAPVFAQGTGGPGVLLGPTGGYLLAFPVAAALAGAGYSRRGVGRGWLVLTVAGSIAGLAVVYALGAGRLAAVVFDGDLGRALTAGVVPFVVPDLFKLVTVWLLASAIRSRGFLAEFKAAAREE